MANRSPLIWFLSISALIVVAVIIAIIFTQSKQKLNPVITDKIPIEPLQNDFVVATESTATDDLPPCGSSESDGMIHEVDQPYINKRVKSSYFPGSQFDDDALNLIRYQPGDNDLIVCEKACDSDPACVMYEYSSGSCKKLNFLTDPVTGKVLDIDQHNVYYTTIIDRDGKYVRSYRGRGFTSTFTPEYNDRTKALNACKSSNKRGERYCVGISCMDPRIGPQICQLNYLQGAPDSIVGVINRDSGN